MNISKLFWISSGIFQEFWMHCVVKLNTVTQNTQLCELQSILGCPSLEASSSGSTSLSPSPRGASTPPTFWLPASLTKVLSLKRNNIWTNADNWIEQKSKAVLSHCKAGNGGVQKLSVAPGQPAGRSADTEMRSRPSTQGTETQVTTPKGESRGWEKVGFDSFSGHYSTDTGYSPNQTDLVLLPVELVQPCRNVKFFTCSPFQYKLTTT